MRTQAGAGRGQDPLIIEGGPELFFRVARPAEDGVAVRSSMPAGPWLNVTRVTATSENGKPCVIATVTAGVPQRG